MMDYDKYYVAGHHSCSPTLQGIHIFYKLAVRKICCFTLLTVDFIASKQWLFQHMLL